MKIVENVTLDYMPEMVCEADKENSKFLKIGGTALVVGESGNNRVYTAENILENNGKEFKFLVGHPKDNIEDHVVGRGTLRVVEGVLKYEGTLMNTARHPDILEKVKAGLLGPSIHAQAEKITEKANKYHLKGLDVRGMGLVAFQGVKSASIDYAIAESFQGVEEQDEIDTKNEQGEQTMAEANIKPEAVVPIAAPAVAETDAIPPREAPITGESVSMAEHKAVVEELAALKLKNKTAVVESIISVNKNLKKEELITESEDKLNLILEYEKKLAKPVVAEAAVVESDQKATKTESSDVLESDGSLRLSDEAYRQFNEELKKRI